MSDVFDKDLRPLSEVVLGLVDWRDEQGAPIPAVLKDARLELPIELAVRIDEGGEVRVEGSPPRQQTETTILPVFHRLKLRVMLDADENRS